MMTQEQYRKKWNKIAYPEMLGTVICYSVAIMIFANIRALETWYNILLGVLSATILLVLPVLSLRSIY
ncbi:hypothetical protein ACWGOQ_0009085 [Aquimarina sp. M1]